MTETLGEHDDRLDLLVSRHIDAPRSLIWEAWTVPENLVQWWCPRPWTTELRAFELYPGGAFHAVMHGPDGGISDNPGVFLEIVPQERIVFTSMLVKGWRPASPWLALTGIFTMEDEGDGTRYTARALHKDDADRQQHEELGFYEGWNTCITQLSDFTRNLAARKG